ncbi:hypothetical protein ACJIZ3_009852 [Penstemon smallii]|uniref:Cytochrome P450 n=1 Tax=Penstemon smallii TaxID=265156 RepID=A0ABD3TDP5_9LAMI
MEKWVVALLIIKICGCVLLVLIGWKILNWVWIRPKRLEKYLRKQGLSGNSYRLLYGDIKETATLMKLQEKPMNYFSNDIVHRLFPFILQTLTNYGKNCFVWFGPTPAAIILDADTIREILTNRLPFPKPSHNPANKLLTQGLATYEAHKWAKHRKLLNPTFQIDKLKLMVPAFYLSCCDMLNKWEEIVGVDGSRELDVWPYIQALTSDAISRTAFGSNYEEGRKIFELQNEQIELVKQQNLSLYIPGMRVLPTKANRRMKAIAEEVKSSVMEIIEKKMRAIESGLDSTDDLLGLLLESNFKEIQRHGNEFGMSFQDVIEECKQFYFVGQETTSSLLVWTMILLSRHLDWQERAREEISRVLGRGKPDYDKLNQLNIVNMIFHEVLRLYPPLPTFNRIVEKEISLGKITLPVGVRLVMPLILLHHDQETWGNDAKEFNPQRFSEGVSKATTKGQISYFPFGWGPRVCIGQNFAMLEAKMALSMILRDYSLEFSPSYAHAPHTKIILQPQYGAHLILHKI